MRTHGRHGDQIVIGDVVDILGVSGVSAVPSGVSWTTSAVVVVEAEKPRRTCGVVRYIELYPKSETNCDHDQPNRFSLFPHCFRGMIGMIEQEGLW